jgi:hypothetical protein
MSIICKQSGDYKMYYSFISQEHFDSWHTVIKEQLGIPMADGITIAYTELLQKDDGELYAYVDEEFAEGLTATTPPPDKPRT